MQLLSVKSHEPKRKFFCERCDALGMVSPKGVYRRFEVHLSDSKGTPGVFCVVCASILIGRRQGDFMQIGRGKA